MTNNTQPAAASPVANASGMRSEIATKWSKFSTAEIAGFKNNADLVTQLQSKYTLDKVQAQKDVDTFAKGRQL